VRSATPYTSRRTRSAKGASRRPSRADIARTTTPVIQVSPAE
jgi:hypothetical protein